MTHTVHEGVDATIDRRNRYLTANYPRYDITVVEGSGCEFTDSSGKDATSTCSPGSAGRSSGTAIPSWSPRRPSRQASSGTSGTSWTPSRRRCWPRRSPPTGSAGAAASATPARTRTRRRSSWCGSTAGATARDRYKVIATERGFHGRGFAAMNATAGDKVRKGYDPFLDGFVPRALQRPGRDGGGDRRRRPPPSSSSPSRARAACTSPTTTTCRACARCATATTCC